MTLFIYPSAISNAPYALTWPELTEMAASGLVDIQSHTYWHPNFRQEKARRSQADYRAVRGHAAVAFEAGDRGACRSAGGHAGVAICHSRRRAGTGGGRAGYVAAFILGNRAARSDDMLALPRFWISDSDRAGRLSAALSTACPVEKGRSPMKSVASSQRCCACSHGCRPACPTGKDRRCDHWYWRGRCDCHPR